MREEGKAWRRLAFLEALSAISPLKLISLLDGQPVADPRSDLANSFHPPNCGGHVWTEDTVVHRLICQSPDRCQSDINRRLRQAASSPRMSDIEGPPYG